MDSAAEFARNCGLCCAFVGWRGPESSFDAWIALRYQVSRAIERGCRAILDVPRDPLVLEMPPGDQDFV